MRFWVGVTDNEWFRFLADRQPEEVNFWQPSTSRPFANLLDGAPFLFKLKKPHNHVAGGGYFVGFEQHPLWRAWEAFGELNGAPSLRSLEDLIRPSAGTVAGHPQEIGCSLLMGTFFWEPSEWIAVDSIWKGGIQRGRYFDSAAEDGRWLWGEVEARLAARPRTASAIGERPSVFGAPTLVKTRPGQRAFKILVTERYRRRCAVTGESTLPALEAAHIRPVSQLGQNDVSNGLLLRSDFHKLFDAGLITIQPDHRMVVSPRIREQYFNGKVYYHLHGQPLASIPERPGDRPDPEMLRWHNEQVFERKAS